MSRLKLLFQKKHNLLLILIIGIAALLRFYNISYLPPSLYWDEVSIGYNGYSIAQTLRDEHGNFLPILFRGYDDYKLPLYIYLTAVSTKIFGLNEFAVRFPSAFLGTASILVVYFLTLKLFASKNKLSFLKNPKALALLTSFFFAISPWHIQFSRGGFEANAALFLTLVGTLFFVIGKAKRQYVYSIICFALAMYTYRSSFVFVPIFLIGLHIVWFWGSLKKMLIREALGFCLLLILILPVLVPLLSEGSARSEQTSITLKVNEEGMRNFETGEETNRKVLHVKYFAQGYISIFNPTFLFLSGDTNMRHSVSGMGMLYLWELPFIVMGMIIIFSKFNRIIGGTILVWLLAAPIAAALSIPIPHALRTLNLLPLPQLLTAIGVLYLANRVPSKVRLVFVCILALVISIFFVRYAYFYHESNKIHAVESWGDGHKQLVQYLQSVEDVHDKILVTGASWQPYMYTLFYTGFDPADYQKSGNPSGFGKYVFGGTVWDRDVSRETIEKIDLSQFEGKNLLFAIKPEERNLFPGLNVVKSIQDSYGKEVFLVGEL